MGRTERQSAIAALIVSPLLLEIYWPLTSGTKEANSTLSATYQNPHLR